MPPAGSTAGGVSAFTVVDIACRCVLQPAVRERGLIMSPTSELTVRFVATVVVSAFAGWLLARACFAWFDRKSKR